MMKKGFLFFSILVFCFILDYPSYCLAQNYNFDDGAYGAKSYQEIYDEIKREKEADAEEEIQEEEEEEGGEESEIKTEDKGIKEETLETEEVIPPEEFEAAPRFLFEETPNPHLGIRCETCHREKPSPTSKDKEIHTLAGNYKFNEVDLCEKCHPGVNLHPVGMDPDKLEDLMLIPEVFPLGKYGDIEGKLTCSTCHKLHSEVGNFHLLRGFPKNSRDFDPLFENRQTFCESCHGEQVVSQSPHKGDAAPCDFCHKDDPKTSEDPIKTLRQKTESICYFCHERISSNHFRDANPYIALNEKPGCTTCHDSHGYSKKGYFITSEYEKLANSSKKTNPHLRKAFCLTCHTEKPAKGNSALRFEGNIPSVCFRCHKDDYPWRTADFHPIDVLVEGSGKKVPKVLPLFNGKISCLTCHLLECQVPDKKKTKKTNPKFLAGGPYEFRSDICFHCHDRDKYKKHNVHDQINKRGILRKDICLYCHRTPPDRKVRGRTKVQQAIKNLLAPLTDLCVRCHRDTIHPGERNHLKPASSQMLKRKSVYEIEHNVYLPLDAKGNVTCPTCHNPHEKGIIPWGPGTKGADEPARLRLTKKDGLLCEVCHSRLGLK